MLKLRVVQSRFGDSLILENGSGARKKYILVDGGPSRVYGPYLRGELAKIAAAGGKLDLVVLTHIDNDHVLGLLEFMDDLRLQKAAGLPPFIHVDALWHNGFSKILPEAVQRQAEALEYEVALTPNPDPENPVPEEPGPYGYEEGHELQLADAELGIPRNPGFPGGLVTTASAPRRLRAAGMWLWIIGPRAESLERLRELWVGWLVRKNLPFAPGEEPVKPDESAANLSSIMFLAESRGRRILLTGDGLSTDIVDGLEKAGLLPSEGTMHVDIFKVPHHGSARNNLGDMFDRVLADTYVLCANGRYGNPDWQTLVWLVDAACRQNRDIHIFATSPAPALERLIAERPPESNHYRLTVMPKGETSALI